MDQPKGRLAGVRQDRPVAFDEILIGIGGVKLDDFKVAAVKLALLGDFASNVGLTGARRPVEDDLAFFLQVVDDFL